MANKQIKELFYITHVNNLPSILKHGIFSHSKVTEGKVNYTPIYDEQIVTNRKSRMVGERSLWDYTNLYFQPRNAMLYRVLFHGKTSKIENIAIIAIKFDILNRQDIFITSGNAASLSSEIIVAPEIKRELPQIQRAIDKDWWNDADESKREMMAECLVPDLVPREYISAIYVANHQIKNAVEKQMGDASLPTIPEPKMFFQPLREISITDKLSVLEGDMFFSRMQTLTVSVNCVGIMGKGLASRAKYQFPDVYVRYQDLCRSRKLQMGKPVLYKRERPLDSQLVDEPYYTSQLGQVKLPSGGLLRRAGRKLFNMSNTPDTPQPLSLQEYNQETWFLLFPTKKHWRENADIQGIEQGLQWIQQNYFELGIKSLAVPALGCGLGKLDWREVGPLMVKHLAHLNIPVQIYLPAEKKIDEKYLGKAFLLGKENKA